MNNHRQTGGASGDVGGGWSKSRSRCAEGATGGFFDTDIVLANPTSAIAPISVDFLPEGGAPISITRPVNAVEPLTLSLDPLVPDAAVSTVVHSTNAVPLAAERTMIWDSTGYGGHGGSSAVPAGHWLFAEGSQGYFSTFILLANDNTTDASVTLNFLLEGGGVVTQTRTVPPEQSRCGDAGARDTHLSAAQRRNHSAISSASMCRC